MADEVKLEVGVHGAEEAGKKLDELAKKQDAATEATKKDTAAARDNTTATNSNADALKRLGETATAATRAREAHANAARSHAQSMRDEAAAMGYVKKSAAEMSADLKRAQVHADALKRGAKGAGGALDELQTFSNAANQAQTALAQLMSGNLVGAFKSATAAAISFSKAIVANPILLAIGAIVAAVGGIVKAYQDAKRAREEFEQGRAQAAALRGDIDIMRNGGIENLSDAALERKRREAADKVSSAALNTDLEGEVLEDYEGLAQDSGKYKKRYKRQLGRFEAAKQEEADARDALRAIEEEQARRRGDAKASSDEGTARAKERADRERQQREELAERQKEFDRDLQQARIESGKGGKMAGLEYRREELLKDRTELEKRVAPMREMGFALNPEDEKKLLDINEKLLQVNQQITSEKQQQKKEAEQQAATEAKRLESEKKEQAERLEKAKKEAAEFQKKQTDFLHRNDSDAQRLASIGKQLEAAGATGDQAQMLELMMAGEDIAENYQEPQTKRQQRRAARKAERDAKAAMREARAFRKQVAGVEAAWGAGDKSAAEAVAGMHTDAQGNTYAMKMNDNGKMVKVEGQDLTNDLLEEIKKALT